MRFDGIVLPDRARLREAVDDIRKGRGGISLYLSLLGLLAGFLAIGCIFLLGHAHTTNTSDLVPWGIQITTYVYFVLISPGCPFVTFLGAIFYEEEYSPYASRVMFLAIVTALAAFISLATEMGRIDRMYYFLISPNPASPMFWMSVWYAADIFIIVLEYINIRRSRHSRKVMWAAFFVAVVTYGTLGSLFGAVGSRAYYYSALLPIYFLFMAFLPGGALCSLVAAVEGRKTLGDGSPLPAFFTTFLKIGLGLALFAIFWRLMIGLTGHARGFASLGPSLLDGLRGPGRGCRGVAGRVRLSGVRPFRPFRARSGKGGLKKWRPERTSWRSCARTSSALFRRRAPSAAGAWPSTSGGASAATPAPPAAFPRT